MKHEKIYHDIPIINLKQNLPAESYRFSNSGSSSFRPQTVYLNQSIENRFWLREAFSSPPINQKNSHGWR